MFEVPTTDSTDDATRPMCGTHFTTLRLESVGWTCMSCDSEKLLAV